MKHPESTSTILSIVFVGAVLLLFLFALAMMAQRGFAQADASTEMPEHKDMPTQSEVQAQREAEAQDKPAAPSDSANAGLGPLGRPASFVPSYARGVVKSVDIDARRIMLATAIAADSVATTQSLQLAPDSKIRLTSVDGKILNAGTLHQIDEGMYVMASGEHAYAPGQPFMADMICAGPDQAAVSKLLQAEVDRMNSGRPSLTEDESTSASSKVKIYD